MASDSPGDGHAPSSRPIRRRQNALSQLSESVSPSGNGSVGWWPYWPTLVIQAWPATVVTVAGAPPPSEETGKAIVWGRGIALGCTRALSVHVESAPARPESKCGFEVIGG